jgi:hypothetical protein
VSGGFSPLPHAGHEISEADTHVESCGDVLSDAGSTPAASTNNRRIHSRIRAFSRAVPAASTIAPRMEPNLGECEWFSQLWLLDFLRDFDHCDDRRIRQPTGI